MTDFVHTAICAGCRRKVTLRAAAPASALSMLLCWLRLGELCFDCLEKERAKSIPPELVRR